MSTAEQVSLDRRQRRRLETIEEVLDIAVEIMGEQGVGGLSIGEVARRMGIRPPSLYVYFPSKHALYDALFERGARAILDVVREQAPSVAQAATLEEALLDGGTAFIRWAVEHPAYTQLLFWRPVPGFTPSEQAYSPAVELVALITQRFTELQQRGLIRADADIDELHRDWTIVTAGIVSQQLSNAPHESFDSGAFTSRLPDLVAIFARHYAAPTHPSPRRRARRADHHR